MQEFCSQQGWVNVQPYPAWKPIPIETVEKFEADFSVSNDILFHAQHLVHMEGDRHATGVSPSDSDASEDDATLMCQVSKSSSKSIECLYLPLSNYAHNSKLISCSCTVMIQVCKAGAFHPYTAGLCSQLTGA